MVRKYTLPQQSWASGVTAATTPTMSVHGRVEQIVVKINNNTGSATLTLAITSENESGSLYSQAAIPKNATTVYRANSEKATQDANFDAFLVDEKLTFTCTPSGDPSTSGMTADIAIYVTDG